jgi:integrase
MQHAEIGKSGLCLEPGREKLFLATTKEGFPLERVIPSALADALRVALRERADQHDALFLTDRGRPYSRGKTQGGSRFKTAWKSARARVIIELTRKLMSAKELEHRETVSQLEAEIQKVSQATPHWSRHTMISRAIEKGINDRVVMELSGHRSIQMVGRYTHLRDASIRNAAELVAME